MTHAAPDTLAFDDVVIDFAGRRLLRGGSEQMLEPKAFAVLALLAGTPGRAVSRDEILDAVWGHRHVTQSVLNRIMSLLRQALGEDAQHPRRLHTVHGVGYRFDLPAATAPDVPASTLATPSFAADTSRSRRRPWLRLVPVVAVALVVIAIAGTSWMRSHIGIVPTATSVDASARSLAVLPFADLSQSHDQGYLADGLAEEILNQLAQIPALRVVGRTSSFSFKDKNEDSRSIGRQLGVAHLLEGSVRQAGDQLRITAQLIRADDGSNLWSRTYARELRDVFAVQEEISRDVARALSVKLDAVRFNREQGGTTNVDAYERYLRWRNIVMLEQADFEHDRERLHLAREMVALDPQCVLCRDALASSLVDVAQEVGGVQAEQLRAESAQVRQAISSLAPDSWVAKRDRSNALWLTGKRAEAIALAREIADSGPATKERVWDYAYMIYAMGHLNETIALVEQVRAIDPMAIFLSRDLQYDYTAARRFADAEAEYQRSLKLEGSQFEPRYVAFIRQLAGKRPGGTDSLRVLHQQLLGESPYLNVPFFRDLGPVLHDREAMLAIVRRATADPHAYGGGRGLIYVRGHVADALGDVALAVAALREDLEATEGFRDGAMAQYHYVAFWNLPYSGVRNHPDFKHLLIEAGVVDYWRQTGKWGDGCRPLPANDFECS